MIELNKIYNEDCLEGMKRIPDGSVDLTVTSPPYDNLRSYNGNNDAWSEDSWKTSLKELYRATAKGGVVVWVVSDATVKGSETGTSFKQALYAKEVGFRLYDTMIWRKPNTGALGNLKAYENVFEYMFVFSKGKPKTTNIIKDKPNKRAGELQSGSMRKLDGTVKKDNKGYGTKQIEAYGRRHNVWDVNPVKNNQGGKHPAPFPIQLVKDHIITWSDEGEIVLDPFAGSGTTAIAAMNTNRNFICFELDETYYNLANKRIEDRLQEVGE